MKNTDSNILLYAKGWYKKTNLIDDMKVLVSHKYMWNKEDCTIGDIVSCCIDLLCKYCILDKPKYILKQNFEEILQDLNPNEIWKCGYEKNRSYSYEEAIIRKTLSMLGLLSVRNGDKMLIELDEPDVTILPLSKDAIDSKRKVND